MNQIYVILGSFVWKILNKKVGLWYAHGHVPLSLRIAEKLADIIFTSSDHGFRMISGKINIVGQGIDTEKFAPSENKEPNKIFKIITVGRISPVKDYETIIEAVDILVRDGKEVALEVVGGPGNSEQIEYQEMLKEMVVKKNLTNNVMFLGPMTNDEIIPYLQRADIFVSMSRTGSMDKAILEAMACGLPVITCNEALINMPVMNTAKGDYQMLSFLIEKFKSLSEEDRNEWIKKVRVCGDGYKLSGLIGKILNGYGK